ncbi:MAG: GNAT family N-acetyltransferase [Leptothrix sp. (in: Bacteria)]|nr:GNAT family N-acetyltransferase [Leptothrix sp. (in: b-proteobacteria)]
MTACTLRPAVADDARFLFDLYAGSRMDELAGAGWTAPQRETFLRLQYAARDAHYRSAFPAASDHIVLCGDAAAGRLLVAHRADALHLVDLALLPACQGRGLGSALLRELQREAEASQRRVLLHVEMHNRARGLYLRLGFAEMATQGLHVSMCWPPAARAAADTAAAPLRHATRIPSTA